MNRYEGASGRSMAIEAFLVEFFSGLARQNDAMRRVAARSLEIASARLQKEAADTADPNYRIAAQDGLRVLEEMRREMLLNRETELH